MESLKPKYAYNPALQQLYQCVQHRAMHPEIPLPKLDPLVQKYLTTILEMLRYWKILTYIYFFRRYVNPDEKLFANAEDTLKEFAAKFPLQKTGMHGWLSSQRISHLSCSFPREDTATLLEGYGKRKRGEVG